nr:retrovirus-related Pol polyprotein from transposon TNT 1-94 [Tanacetum cinerariifolium]
MITLINVVNCDDLSTAQAVLMAKISNYGSEVTSERIKPTLYDGIVIFEKHVAMPVIDDEETLILKEESRSKMSEKEKDPEAIKQNISHKPIDYEKLNRLIEDFGKHFTPQQELLVEQAFWLCISNPTIESSSTPPVKVEVPSKLPKVSLVNESLKKLKFQLAQFDSVVKKRTTPNALIEDSGCSKHMTRNRSQLMNFVSKFLGIVRFGNDQIARIMGYGDFQLGSFIISRVYYVEGLRHNLFSVSQFCDADLKVAFWKNTYFIRNLEGVDLLLGSRDINLYTISLDDILKSSPICLLSKASKTKSWLWRRRLSHLNLACALGKSKKSSHQPKAKDTNQEKIYLLHMDLCGPMRVASINGKRYILVIVDDFSRFTWVRFLRTNDEAIAAIIKCIKNIQVRLKATVCHVRTNNGTEFVN